MRISNLVIAVVFAATLNISPRDGRANVIGPTDDRGSLVTLGPKLGLTAVEIKQARGATGYIRCPGSKYKNGGVGSAALVLSNQTIVTVAHAFLDPQGRWREPLAECHFQPQSEAFPKIKIDPDNIVVGSHRPYGSQARNDWAVVRLKAPVNNAIPYPVLSRDAPAPHPTTRLVSIAARAKGVSNDAKIPIVQECQVMTFLHTGPIHSDCDASQGMSGSIILTRHAGELFATGITIGTGLDSQDRKPFKLVDIPEGSFTKHLVFRDDFLLAVTNMAKCGKPMC
jgi:hypothetical protein